jgi:hypothetical protein
LSQFSDAPITFELLAVTEEQIIDWNLPTRPAKATDSEAYKFGADAVELDAIPVGMRLIGSGSLGRSRGGCR